MVVPPLLLPPVLDDVDAPLVLLPREDPPVVPEPEAVAPVLEVPDELDEAEAVVVPALVVPALVVPVAPPVSEVPEVPEVPELPELEQPVRSPAVTKIALKAIALIPQCLRFGLGMTRSARSYLVLESCGSNPCGPFEEG